MKTPFIHLANWRKRQKWYQFTNIVKHQAIQEKDNRLFFSYDMFHYEEEGKTNYLNLSWADIKFPSKMCKNKVYLGCLATCQYIMIDSMRDFFHEQILKETKDIQSDDIIFENRQIKLTKIPIPQFENRTRFEETEKRLEDWLEQQAANQTYQIFEKWDFDYTSRYFIIINAVLDVPYFRIETVNEWINRFYDMGEVEYTSSTPADKKNLVFTKDWCKVLDTGIANPLI